MSWKTVLFTLSALFVVSFATMIFTAGKIMLDWIEQDSRHDETNMLRRK